jgi:hypothetical protein
MRVPRRQGERRIATMTLNSRRPAIGARIVRGFARAVLMQERGTGVAHDI